MATQVPMYRTLDNAGLVTTSDIVELGDLRAGHLETTSGDVTISNSAPPSANQTLVATSATEASWNFLDISAGTTGTLPVSRGGTGQTTLTSGNVLVGAGAAAISATKAAPTGNFVGTTDTQTLTNKTLTAPTINNGTINTPTINTPTIDTPAIDSATVTNSTITGATNTVHATHLRSATGAVDVSAATAPTAGQVLTATSATTAIWDTPATSGVGAITICEAQATGVNSATTLTNATWNTRQLNTIFAGIGGTGITLLGNSIRINSGSYIVTASAPAFDAGTHRIRLHDPTGAFTYAIGSAAYSASNAQTSSLLSGSFTVASETFIELQHWVNSGTATAGSAVSTGELEIYAIVQILSVA